MTETTAGSSAFYSMRFSIRQAPYNDGRFRAAISTALDRRSMPDRFFGGGVQVHGTATVVPLPEAMEPLIDYFRRTAGREHDDWDEYRRAMERERRVLIRIDIEGAERA